MTKTIEQIQGMNIPIGALIKAEANEKDENEHYIEKADNYAGYYSGLKMISPWNSIELVIASSSSLAHKLSRVNVIDKRPNVQNIKLEYINDIKIL
jgi:hypothetical protein